MERGLRRKKKKTERGENVSIGGFLQKLPSAEKKGKAAARLMEEARERGGARNLKRGGGNKRRGNECAKGEDNRVHDFKTCKFYFKCEKQTGALTSAHPRIDKP